MQKISLQKRSFFNSIGLDVKNMPSELKIKISSMQNKLPIEDISFFKNEKLVSSSNKYFRLKNLIGTVSDEYDGQTWIEVFINNKNSDEIIKQYFKNPNYYFRELRKLDQTTLNHNNELELYEDNGKIFIKDGVSRLALMMIKYLLEMSRAQTKEERLIINKQYTFVANVKSIPKDRDIIYLINMLLNIYGEKLKIEKSGEAVDECQYLFKYGTKSFEIKSKNELENFIKNSYLPKEYKSEERLKNKILNLIKIGLAYKKDETNEEAFLVMGKIFPNYEVFIKYYKKIQKYDIEQKLFEKLDLENITYEVILKKMIKIVKQEEKENKKQKTSEKKNSSEKKTNKLEKAKEKNAKDINKTIEKNNEESKDEIKELKAEIDAQIDYILENISLTYYGLKTEEAKVMVLACSAGITLNIDKLNEDSINLNINEIKEQSIKFRKNIETEESIKKLKDYKEVLKDLKKLADDKNIGIGYSDEMNKIFINCFNKTIQKMITDAKLKKLELQRIEIEKEKCSFFSKLIGKAKLKQAKLDNINLKKQLILSESQFTDKSYNYLEDGLSDIYIYLQEENDNSYVSDIKLFFKNIENNSQIKTMIDNEKLNKLIEEKQNHRRNLPQLVLSKEKRRLFSKAQINLMEEKNNELKRVIQITRANSLKLQNTGMIPILGNIKTTKSVNKFCKNLSEINNTIKYQI